MFTSPVRWSVGLGTGLLLALTGVTPAAAASAAAAPTAVSVTSSRTPVVEVPQRALVERAVAPSECGPTLLDDYVDQLLAGMTSTQITFLLAHLDTLLSVPTYDALFFGTTGDPDYALDTHAQQLRKTFSDLRRFWSDVQTADIQLMAMHGDVLLDADRIADTLTLMVETNQIAPLTPAQITAEAQTVATFMQGQGDFYDNPLWTLNAFAFSGEGETDPILTALPDKLVMGDGVLDFTDAVGIGDVGPRMILAHEFGHHVQYELGVFDTGPSDPAAATRRTELMADAMATYFGVHKKGLALNEKRVVDALLSFYVAGDCNFDSAGHHGTPLQRQRAAEWGAQLAASAQPKSYVLPAAEFVARFDAALPSIISG